MLTTTSSNMTKAMKKYVILHKPESQSITVMNDPSMTLYAWQLLIQELIAKHGPNAVLSTDAGYNNVELQLAALIEEREKNSYQVT